MIRFVQKLAKSYGALWRDRRGMVLQETAMTMPLLVLMTLGGVEIARFALLNQKLDRWAMTTADIVSQGKTISESQISSIFTASSTVMSPFSLGPDGRAIVTSVYRATGGTPKVVWQRSGGGSFTGTSQIGTPNSNATLPTGFVVREGETVIIAEVFYSFEPVFMSSVVPPRVVYHRAMFRPRLGSLQAVQPG